MKKILIRLEGYLKQLYPEGVAVAAGTAREALGLLCTYPGFRPEEGRRHYVRVDIINCYDDLDHPLIKDELVVTPILGGAGGGNAGRQILIGALLIGISLMVPGIGAVMHGKLAVALFSMGASMVLGGVLMAMQRAPKADPTSGDKRSRFLSSTKNTVEAGTPIPLLYGTIKAGGHFLTFDVDAEDYVPE